jgi:hypothetical protein
MRKLLFAITVFATGWYFFPDEFRAVGIFVKEAVTLIILGK